MLAARTLLLAVLLATLSACIEQTTVIGDDRSRHACEDAILIDAPSFGCTTVTLQSRGPYGCTLRSASGAWLEEHAGSWVRLHRGADSPATLRIRVLSGVPECVPDGGTASCSSAAYLTTVGDAPCSCVLGALEGHLLSTSGVNEIPLVSTDQEVLLEPLGATFEVSICVDFPVSP